MQEMIIKGLVSIIMPVYNSEKYIDDAIQSVLSQTYSNWELIIVNDGCTDKTVEKIKSYKDERIFLYNLDKNMGRGFARNYAIKQCRGEFVAIFDADDISLPRRLELQVKFLNYHKEISIVGGQALYFSDNIPSKKLKYLVSKHI